MSLFDDYEGAMKKFMPAFKARAANMMIKEFGITQQRAAVLLGVTQAAISKYINKSTKSQTSVKINEKDVKAFVEMVSRNDLKGGRRILCRMCQENAKYGCALMTK